MKKSLLNTVVLAVLAFAMFLARVPLAHASAVNLELRSPLGALLTPQASALNNGLVDELKIKYLLTFGADILVLGGSDATEAFQGWGAGLRFDSLTTFLIHNEDRLEAAANVFSLMAHKRWAIGENSYAGPTLTAGVYQPSVINYKRHPATWERFEADRAMSFTGGVEAGWIWDIYLVSFELGYQSLRMKGLASDKGAKLQTPGGTVEEVDFSGPYAKFLIGLHFF